MGVIYLVPVILWLYVLYDPGENYLIAKRQPYGPKMCEQQGMRTVACTHYLFNTSTLLCKLLSNSVNKMKHSSDEMVKFKKKKGKKREGQNCPPAAVVLKTRTRSDYCVRSTDSCLKEGYQRLSNVNVCYKKHTEERTWPAARKICQEEGGDLISMNTKQKYKATVDAIKRGYPNVKIYRIWVGMRRSPRKRRSRYRWMERGANFRKWSLFEPSFSQGEACVFVGKDGLADAHCHSKHHFMCEMIQH